MGGETSARLISLMHTRAPTSWPNGFDVYELLYWRAKGCENIGLSPRRPEEEEKSALGSIIYLEWRTEGREESNIGP
jgi:hypothetical protein